MLIDPPVTAFSPPDQIAAWIEELKQLALLPENREKGPRRQIRSAIAQARGWLRTSKRLDIALAAGARKALPHPPAT
ncbi:MAG: hypothetical protein ACJ8GN_13725 [Longimicrobiaceae bacterium]